MDLYQNLKVMLNPDYPGFQEVLIELVENSEGWSIRKDIQDNFEKKGLFRDRRAICVQTPEYDFENKRIQGVIWTYDYGTHLETFNIIPISQGRLHQKEYNYLLNEFVKVFINKTAADFHANVLLSNPVLDLRDHVVKEVIDALMLFSDLANKSTGNTHPMDFARWCDFILISSRNVPRLSVEYLVGWLVDNGWSEEMASELGLNYEYSLGLLDYEHNRR